MYGPAHNKAVSRWFKIRLLVEFIRQNKILIEDLEAKQDRSDAENLLLTSLRNKMVQAKSMIGAPIET